MNSSSARAKTFPVGLFGVFKIMALVEGPKAAASWSRSKLQSGGRSLTKRGAAPLRIASGP